MPKIIENKLLIRHAYYDRHNNNLNARKIAVLFNVSYKSVYNYVNTEKEDITTIINRSKHIIPKNISEYITNKAINNPNFSVKKIRKNIKKLFKVNIKRYEVYRILKDNNITHKKANIKNTTIKSIRPLESIKDLHKKITTINKDNEDNIVFTDEFHLVLDKTLSYGWNKKGKEVTFIKNTPSKIVNKRFSVIMSISRHKKIGYKIFDKSCNSKIYKKYIKKISKKTNKKYFYKDNASIHKAKIVRNTMKRLGKKPIYGVPYTPELNISEYVINILKKKIYSTDFSERMDIHALMRKCWKSLDDGVISKIYDHVYDDIHFCDRCV